MIVFCSRSKTLKRVSGGYVALVGVLVFSALILLVGIGVSLRGINIAEGSLDEAFAAHARTLADACAEEALLRLKSNFGYAGNETIIVGGSDTCTIVSVSGSGNTDRVILAEAAVGRTLSRVRVDVERLTPSLLVRAWDRVPN